ncbi:protein-disulfide reductase DsbD domain-containing protein [Martelella soudanensis]|uniref:protein-disulfide reductase DsbD domain-containing protein n=1 Tax=unclassified Martelella TaxID=2629616 RepID=UPI0015DDFC67|nr:MULTISPECIES: protein-disulfide reductase DsbD domain-containing protein [unclassified Martelella]
MKTRRILFIATLALPAFTAMAHAGQTAWAEDAGGRMRMIVTAPDDNGTIRAALQVEPAEGFITYWREPGESGIPPQITVNGSNDVTLEAIAYPVPKRIDLAGVTDMGYDGPVTFPLTLKAAPGTLPEIEVSAFIGLCKDICIPFQTTFEIASSTYADSAVDTAILAVAATTLPEAPSADFRVERAVNTGLALELALALPDPGNPEITLASSDGFIVKAPAGAMKDGFYTISIPLKSLPDGQDSIDGDWLLLAKAGGRAMETPLVFETVSP